MKHLKKILALVLIAVSLLAVALPALAVYTPQSVNGYALQPGQSKAWTNIQSQGSRINWTVGIGGVSGNGKGEVNIQKNGTSMFYRIMDANTSATPWYATTYNDASSITVKNTGPDVIYVTWSATH